MNVFDDRRQAGRALGKALGKLQPARPVVMALPRGGVPVGFEVASTLSCPLDILLVRKLGLPGQPELAMGAIAEGGVVILNQDVLGLAGVDESELASEIESESRTLERYAARFRDEHPPVDPTDRTVLIVDDGLATGSTALAGVSAMQHRGARQVWVCVPVGPRDTTERVAKVADRVVVLSTPERFIAVGAWYRDFAQTEDEEVRSLLSLSRLR